MFASLIDPTLPNKPDIGSGSGGVPLPVTIVGGGGGGAVTIADGADVAEGAKADAQATNATSAWSVIALLKGIFTGIAAPTPAGSNIIGKVGTDLTTPGTTNKVSLGTDTVITTPLAPDSVTPAGSPFSLSAAGVLFTQDMTGYGSLALQVTSIGTGNTVTIEGSNDNTNWTPAIFDGLTSPTTSSNITGVNAVSIPANYKFIRARISVYASGTVTVVPVLRIAPSVVRSLALAGGGNTIGAVNVGARTTGGALLSAAFRTATAASGNGAAIKASAGQVYGYSFYNSAAAARYIHLYNLATAPTLGTSNDVVVIPIPAGGVVNMNFADIGLAFSTGIAIAVTTAPAANDGTVAGIAVNDVTGMVYYA